MLSKRFRHSRSKDAKTRRKGAEMLKTLASVNLPLIIAARPDEPNDVLVAQHKDAAGNMILTNLIEEPFSPFDGSDLKALSFGQPITAAELQTFPVVANCEECGVNLHASAETAKEIVANKQFHCPVCSSVVTANQDLDVAELDESIKQEAAQLAELKANSAAPAEEDTEELADMVDMSGKDCDDDDDDDDFKFDGDDDDDDDDLMDDLDDEGDEANKSESKVVESKTSPEAKVEAKTEDSTVTLKTEDGKVTIEAKGDVKIEAAKIEVKAEDEKKEDKKDEKAETKEDVKKEEKKEEEKAEKDEKKVEGAAIETAPVAEVKTEVAPVAEVKTETPVADAVKAAETPVAEVKTEAPVAEVKTEVAPAAEVPAATIEIVPLAASLDWSKTKLDVIRASGNKTYYVFSDDKPVATLKEDKVQDSVKSIFASDIFVRSFLLAASKNFKDATANTFGMEILTSEVPVEKVMIDKYDAKVQELEAQTAEKLTQAKADLQQSFDTALMASIKGTWKDLGNPLRDGLVAALTLQGVSNPEGIVDSVFQEHSLDLFKAVLSKADQLLEKSRDVRDELAHTVEQASFRMGQPETLAARLTRGSKPVELAGTNQPSDGDQPRKSKIEASVTGGNVSNYRRLIKGIH
jgi:hypothetical protein